MFASVTRLRVRSIKFVPSFLWRNFLTERQVMRAPGFLGGRLLVDVRRTFWTLTVWESEKAMKAFRGSGAHAAVMPRLARWCDEASYAHWELASAEIPSWPDASEHVLRDGRRCGVECRWWDQDAWRVLPAPRSS